MIYEGLERELEELLGQASNPAEASRIIIALLFAILKELQQRR